MTYFPHLAPKEPSLEKHERGMFGQQGCSFKPQLNMVFNLTPVLYNFFSSALYAKVQKNKKQKHCHFKHNKLMALYIAFKYVVKNFIFI